MEPSLCSCSKGNLRKLSFGSSACLLLTSASFCAGNETAELDSYEEFIEEVVVTGTHIERRDFNSPSPITTADREQFEFSRQTFCLSFVWEQRG